MTQITTEDVRKLARLSAMYVDEADLPKIAGELQKILEYVEQLDEVDTTGLVPTYQVNGLENIQRDDEIIDYGLSREQLLANAPDADNGQIKVPRVLG